MTEIVQPNAAQKLKCDSGYGLWAMGYGLWAMGYGLWAILTTLENRYAPVRLNINSAA